jgi:GNAT superfamily N-acetyltransferase
MGRRQASSVTVLIRQDDLRGPEIAELLWAHLASARKHSPPESVHALDLEALRAPEITFWTLWDGPDLLGCGALKELDPSHGEIKSMHTAEACRRRGVAARILTHIIGEARPRGGIPVRLPKPPRRIKAADIRYEMPPHLPGQNDQSGGASVPKRENLDAGRGASDLGPQNEAGGA